jgi:hypothetical protein
MVRKVVVGIMAVAAGLACYFAVWAVKYRLPAEPVTTLDLRRSPSDAAFCVSFCASLADNPLGFPGHAYVVWSPSMKVDIGRDLSLAFMPRNYQDQIPSLFRTVKGVVMDHTKGNFRNLSRLTVIVSEADYLRSMQKASAWNADSFKAGNRDCAAFVQYVAAQLPLKTGSSTYLFPQEYLSRLKQINSQVAAPSAKTAMAPELLSR